MNPTRGWRNRFDRLVRAPLLHFLLIGTLLYIAAGAFREPVQPVIVVPQAELLRLRDAWTLSTGRVPTQSQSDALIEQYVRDELLVRKARSFGWDKQDPVVQRRLVRNLRFLDPDDPRSDAALLRHAFELEMEQGDIVVRRRLLERMRLAIMTSAHAQEPSDEELSRYLEEHLEAFQRPGRFRVTQVFSSRDRHGSGLRAASEAIGHQLRENAIPPERAARLSDPFLLQSDLPLWTLRRIGQRFGAGFAQSVASAPVGEWSGPVASSYGEHWLWLHEKQPRRAPSLEEARREVRIAILREREEHALRRALAALRSEVEVRVE